MNLSVKNKLFAGFGAVLLSFSLISILNYIKLNDLAEIVEKMRGSQYQLSTTEQDLLADSISLVQLTSIIGLVVSIVIGIFICVFITNLIVKPIKQVINNIHTIAKGDLTSTPLRLTEKDELSELAKAINEMNRSLLTTVRHVHDTALQISSSSEQLLSTTQQTSSNILEQQSQTEMVAAAMNEMSATAQEVTNHIAGTSQAAQEANSETSEGRNIVDGSIQAIQHLASQIENTADVIHQLEEDSDNIGKVLDVIKGIAEQTNLLALNAAIEAARAGEQGRGFAVVADEVRTLAGRTQESTAEINQVIEKLQTGSQKAVDVMNKSRKEAQSVVDQATQAGTSLSSISSSVERINDMSSQIASASEQQNETVEEINRNVINISELGHKTTSNAEETSTAAEGLTQLAKDLEDSIGKFRI